jgi:hypothetical protein
MDFLREIQELRKERNTDLEKHVELLNSLKDNLYSLLKALLKAFFDLINSNDV